MAGWPEVGADKQGTRYSPLTQITPENVEHLEVAWVYHTGDVAKGSGTLAKSSFEATPILFEGSLFLCTPFNRVIALDPVEGSERWTFDPGLDLAELADLVCRGVAAWRDPAADPDTCCSARIFTATVDARLIALDAGTGRPCPGFGEAGSVDLRHGLNVRHPWEYGVTSPPLVVDGRVVVGAMVADNQRVEAPAGVVRAFDARTGELSWAWNPGAPEPSSLDDRAADATYTPGTPNVWSLLSADEARSLVFAPTGNASPDYFAAARGERDELSSAVVALDVGTGRPVWSFQTVHEDVWDYDVPAQPTLVELGEGAETFPALVQSTKQGFLFVLDRESGRPYFPVEERPVPQGAVPGERLSHTQPVPTRPPPLHPQRLRPEDAWGLTPWDRGHCWDLIAGSRSEGLFTPPSLQGSVHFPGSGGAMNWGGVAVDPKRRWGVVNTMRVATRVRLIPREEWDPALQRRDPFVYSPQHGTPYAVERNALLSPLGAPCNPPPWGTLTAVNLEAGEILWEVPLGTTRDMAPFPFWWRAGVPNIGGPIVTASGLIFIGATTDDYLRAFSLESGEELWRGRLPAGGQATPMTYRLARDGRQYVVIAAGGHAQLGTTPGDAVVAFALAAAPGEETPREEDR